MKRVRHHHREPTRGRIDSARPWSSAKGGHVTPLAQDTLRRGGSRSSGRLRRPALPDGSGARAPTSAGSRSAAITPGIALKNALVAAPARHAASRSPTWAPTRPSRWTIRTSPRAVARTVARGEADAGIVIDGAGIGSAIAANKVRGDPRRDVHRRDDRALFARAQRRERDDARLDAARRAPRRRSASSTSGSARRCAKRATSGGLLKIRRLEQNP